MKLLQGLPVSQGIGLGRAFVVEQEALVVPIRGIEDSEQACQQEIQRYDQTIRDFCIVTEKNSLNLPEKEAEILLGHTMIAQDPEMRGAVLNEIKAQHCSVENAVQTAFAMMRNVFMSMDDDLMRERAADISDIENGLLRLLLGVEELDLSAMPQDSVLVAHELTPSITARMDSSRVRGIVTETGGASSHAAIIARSLEIPAVAGLRGALDEIANGDRIMINGNDGGVAIDPEDSQVEAWKTWQRDWILRKKELEAYRCKPTQTSDGLVLELFSNIGRPSEANKAMDNDAEGIGLFRTEFLFMDSERLPSEEEQFEAYKRAAVTMDNKPVIIRTLDIGGDKAIPYLGLEKEANPFLGFRAIRYCLQKEGLFKEQLRAILRASHFGKLQIMLPLITHVEQLREARFLIQSIKKQLLEDNIAFDQNIPVGVMIETPAAALLADVLAKESDFFSIGTNDLTQYTLAVDRGNDNVAPLYQNGHPAVLQLVHLTIRAAKRAGIPVGMCGEAAGDPELIPLWVGLGLDEFSVSPSFVLPCREIIHKLNAKDCERAALAALCAATSGEVEEIVQTLMETIMTVNKT